MNASRDEIRRQLRSAAAEQRAALPRFAAGLRRATDPGSNTPIAEQAELLGVPHSRRGFLRIGGLSVAASAFLVSCGLGSGTSEPQVNRTGEEPPPSDAKVPEPEIGAELDTTLLLTASSLEALAVFTYDTALENNWLGTDPALISVAELFRDQHTEHGDVVQAATRSLGATPWTEPNPFLLDNVIGPAAATIGELEPEAQPLAVLNLAYQLEDIAAQTYTSAGGLFSSAELRSAGMSIGAVEARHVSVILTALEEPGAPFPFGRTAGAVEEAALITTDGPVTPSES